MRALQQQKKAKTMDDPRKGFRPKTQVTREVRRRRALARQERRGTDLRRVLELLAEPGTEREPEFYDLPPMEREEEEEEEEVMVPTVRAPTRTPEVSREATALSAQLRVWIRRLRFDVTGRERNWDLSDLSQGRGLLLIAAGENRPQERGIVAADLARGYLARSTTIIAGIPFVGLEGFGNVSMRTLLAVLPRRDAVLQALGAAVREIVFASETLSWTLVASLGLSGVDRFKVPQGLLRVVDFAIALLAGMTVVELRIRRRYVGGVKPPEEIGVDAIPPTADLAQSASTRVVLRKLLNLWSALVWSRHWSAEHQKAALSLSALLGIRELRRKYREEAGFASGTIQQLGGSELYDLSRAARREARARGIALEPGYQPPPNWQIEMVRQVEGILERHALEARTGGALDDPGTLRRNLGWHNLTLTLGTWFLFSTLGDTPLFRMDVTGALLFEVARSTGGAMSTYALLDPESDYDAIKDSMMEVSIPAQPQVVPTERATVRVLLNAWTASIFIGHWSAPLHSSLVALRHMLERRAARDPAKIREKIEELRAKLRSARERVESEMRPMRFDTAEEAAAVRAQIERNLRVPILQLDLRSANASLSQMGPRYMQAERAYLVDLEKAGSKYLRLMGQRKG